MQTRPGASAASLFPDAAQSNRSIFYRDGRPATVSEVYANLTRGGSGAPTTAPRAVPAVQPDQGFIQYASARHADRIREQDQLVDLILRGPQEIDGSRGSTTRLSSSMFSSEMLRVLSDAREANKKG